MTILAIINLQMQMPKKKKKCFIIVNTLKRGLKNEHQRKKTEMPKFSFGQMILSIVQCKKKNCTPKRSTSYDINMVI